MSAGPNSSAVITAPFEFDCGTVPPEWIDRNGHVNVTYYLVASEQATAGLYGELGLDEAMRARSGCGMFAAEHHMIYKTELRESDRMLVTALLLDCSDNGIHFLNCILRGSDRVLAAAVENLELHVNLAKRRVEPFLPQVPVPARADDVKDYRRPREAKRIRVYHLRSDCALRDTRSHARVSHGRVVGRRQPMLWQFHASRPFRRTRAA
jgi:acyl-CoA thioester hydrolase